MTAKDYKKIILDKLTDTLKPKGFKKAFNTFIYSNGDLTYYINLQSSQSSTADVLKATLNIEIASTPLYRLQDTSLPEKDCRHFTKRIGRYLSLPQDKWWVMDSYGAVQQATEDIITLLNDKVLPELETIKSTKDLAALWKEGNCPGLTKTQKEEYLSLLESFTMLR